MVSLTKREDPENESECLCMAVSRRFVFPRTLSTNAVCSPFAITINMIAEYEYRKYPKHAQKLTLGLIRPKQKFLGLRLALMHV